MLLCQNLLSGCRGIFLSELSICNMSLMFLHVTGLSRQLMDFSRLA